MPYDNLKGDIMSKKIAATRSHTRPDEICYSELNKFIIKPFTITIMGGSGDLSKRMILPALYHIFIENELPDEFLIIGFGLPKLSDDEYRETIKKGLQQFCDKPITTESWNRFTVFIIAQLRRRLIEKRKLMYACNLLLRVTCS